MILALSRNSTRINCIEKKILEELREIRKKKNKFYLRDAEVLYGKI